jgi:hypothetical protein
MSRAKVGLAATLLAAALASGAAAQIPLATAIRPAPYRAVAVGVTAGPVGVDYFYRGLAPHGYWVQRPSFGWVWMPRGVAAGWRPYTAGRWVDTDYGWTWVSSEDWGWATYHYGRWYDDPDYGWAWVPGTDWGPAWVSWQEGNGYVGWAALPPAVGWSTGIGLQLGGFDLSVGIAPADYCFVGTGSFLAVNVGAHILPAERNFAIFRGTTNITSYGLEGGRVLNRGVQVASVERWTGHPVPRYHLAAMSGAGDPHGARFAGNTLSMFHPAAVVRRAGTPDPAHVAPRAVASAAFLAGRAQEHRAFAARTGLPAGGATMAQRSGAVKPGVSRQDAARAASRPQPRVAHQATSVANARQAQASRQAAARSLQQRRTATAGRQQAARSHQQRAVAGTPHPSATASRSRQRTAATPRRTAPSAHSRQAAHRTPAAAPAHRTPAAAPARRTPQARPAARQASRPARSASPAASSRQQAARQPQAPARPAPPPARTSHASAPPRQQHQQPPPQRSAARGGEQGRPQQHGPGGA